MIMGELFKKARMYRDLFGPMGFWLSCRTRLARFSVEVSARLSQINQPIWFRLKSTDVPTLKKIFVDREYHIDLAQSPSVIVDAGANAGFATIFFAENYPKATIFAIEPELSNFTLLKKNVARYPNVVCLQCALWNENTTVQLVDPGIGPWGFQTHGDSPAQTKTLGSVNAITIESLMSSHNLKCIDLLKVDIEGGEREVFDKSSGWIVKVGVIVAELHDHLKPGCSRSFFTATRDFEFETRKGENVFVLRKTFAPPKAFSPRW